MKKLIIVLSILLACATAFSQRPGPNEQQLLVMQEGPALNYMAVESNGLTFPDGVRMGLPGDLEFDPKGHLWVVGRPGNGINTQTVVEFDENGKYLRSFGEGVFGNRPHGIHIDAESNIWISDWQQPHRREAQPERGGAPHPRHQRHGRQLGRSCGHAIVREPNDVAIGRNGDVFLAQGHAPGAMGDPRILKFDKTGKFIKQWGGRGTEPGKFRVAHGISIDAKGLVWVTDRENSRVQIFDQEGTFVRRDQIRGIAVQSPDRERRHHDGERVYRARFCNSTSKGKYSAFMARWASSAKRTMLR